MDNVFEIINNEVFLLGLTVFCIFIFLLYIITAVKLMKMKKDYKEFMKKLGNGENIKVILDNHIEKINKTITKNEELERFCANLDSDIKRCIQKMRNI